LTDRELASEIGDSGTLRFFEIAFVLVRLDHVASVIRKAGGLSFQIGRRDRDHLIAVQITHVDFGANLGNKFGGRHHREVARRSPRCAWYGATFNYLTSAHVNGRRLNPMVNQRSANAASTAIKAMPTVTETAAADG
jgi:hypothetical protein